MSTYERFVGAGLDQSNDWQQCAGDTPGDTPLVRITSAGGIAIEPGASPEAIAAALDAMERDAVLTPAMERLRLATYLTAVARDLMAYNPQVHVRVERLGGPQPFILMAITRQLYPEGHLANDEAPNLELFDPTL